MNFKFSYESIFLFLYNFIVGGMSFHNLLPLNLINTQSASFRSLVAAESTLQQPMQPARDHPLFLWGFWMCISIVDWSKSVPQFLGGLTMTFDF